MEYNKENYIGREIRLFPNDTYTKKESSKMLMI